MIRTARLASGGLIDRSDILAFEFDGQRYSGYAGDTLASALLANDVHLLGRSFKYHRPRGVFTAGSEEPNALVELRGQARREPNTRATTVELYRGLVANSQNRWPSLKYDILSINSLFSPLFVGGDVVLIVDESFLGDAFDDTVRHELVRLSRRCKLVRKLRT